ncbi:MAG: hypothetical protein ACTS4Z_01035 [Candidatus Hodgkinia cicadicola]
MNSVHFRSHFFDVLPSLSCSSFVYSSPPLSLPSVVGGAFGSFR